MATDASGLPVRPVEHRLADATRLPAPFVWLLATLLLLAAGAAWHNLTGAWQGFEADGQPVWQTSWRIEIIFAVIIGYVFACGGWVVRSVCRDLDALAPALTLDAAELAAERGRIGVFPPATLLAAGAVGVAAGLAMHALVNAMLPPDHVALRDGAWRVVRDITLWVLAVRLTWVVIASSTAVSRLSGRAARIDLLDLRPLGPLAHIGLRGALVFALAASMIAAMAGDVRTLPLTLFSMAVVGAAGALALVLPVRGVHRAIRAAKNAELRSVRAEIAALRGPALAGGMPAPEEAAPLGGLLAYEARIAGVSEWPFDVGTFVRFAAFLALPLGSWIASGMVEWVIARALG